MAFAREFSKTEQEYIILWQFDKSPGMICAELNRWPGNQDDPRKVSGIRNFLYQRRRQETPVGSNSP
jgi:hypothetical protein